MVDGNDGFTTNLSYSVVPFLKSRPDFWESVSGALQLSLFEFWHLYEVILLS